MRLASIACCGALLSSVVNAFDTPYVGARAVGMAGAQAAAPADGTAQFHNPAALSLMYGNRSEGIAAGIGSDRTLRHFNRTESNLSWEALDIQVGGNVDGEVADIISEIDTLDLERFAIEDSLSPDRVQALLYGIELLGQIVEDTQYVDADANVGTTWRWHTSERSSWALGGRLWFNAAGVSLPLDFRQLVLGGISGADISTDEAFQEAALEDDTYQALIAGTGRYMGRLDGEQKDRLVDVGLSIESADYIDYQMSEGFPVDLDDDQLEGVIDILVPVIENTENGLDGGLDDATAILVSTLAVLEVPLSYAYAVTDNLSVGFTVKALFGRIDFLRFSINSADGENIFQQSSETQDDFAWTFDVSALYHWSWGSIGVRARNLTSPTFEVMPFENISETQRYVFSPEVTVGIAWMPSRFTVFTADVDVTSTETLFQGGAENIPVVEEQYVRFGAEFALWAVDLRGGMYRNIAHGESPWVYSAGFGIDLRKFYWDFAIAASLDDTATYDGYEIPETLRISTGIGFGF